MKYVKLFLKIFVFAMIALMFALLILRAFFLDNSGPAKNIIWTDAAVNAYESDPENFKVSWFEAEEYLSEDGYIAIVEVRYLENTKQLEFTVRYRDSNVKKLRDKYGYTNGNDDFSFELFTTKKDGVETDGSYTEVRSEKLFYNYRRLIFENVSFDDDVVNVGVNIIYIGGDKKVDYESLKIKGSSRGMLDYDYSKELPHTYEYDTEKIKFER